MAGLGEIRWPESRRQAGSRALEALFTGKRVRQRVSTIADARPWMHERPIQKLMGNDAKALNILDKHTSTDGAVQAGKFVETSQ